VSYAPVIYSVTNLQSYNEVKQITAGIQANLSCDPTTDGTLDGEGAPQR